ncbi:MAG: 3D domain-containing protein [Selenomonadaceae bacterium]|nr:3D domain-containing protein [Selenomonadaceae bacterium]
MLLRRQSGDSKGRPSTGRNFGVALSGGMMKRKIFEKVKAIEKKFALCMILAGFTMMNTGFTEQEAFVEEPAFEIEQTSANEPTAIAVGENGRIKISEDDEISKALTEVVENSRDVNTTIDEPSAETQAVEVSTIEEVKPVEEIPENVIQTSRGLEQYTQMYGMEATAYLPTDGSAEGLTAMGIPATYGIVAVDPDVIPLGSRVYIPGYGEALAADTGGAIYGYRIDLCMESYDEAMDFGRRNVTVFVLK